MACKRTLGYPFECCEAFPMGIPKAIIDGAFDHTKSWPKSKDYPAGDDGLQFEAL